jgi:cytochrome c-type protein NapB
MKLLRRLLPLLALWAAVAAAQLVDAARGPVPVNQPTDPPRLANAVNDDVRRPRNYDMQPPTIPHRVDGYQIDKNFNKCLDCHARARTEFSQAIPVSPTHYLDRAGKVLPQVSTRRYFCMQCHVAQDPVLPIVGNAFEGVDAHTQSAAEAARSGKK